MSEVPSWLNEENISTGVKVAQNPAAQKAAVAVAKSVPPPPPPTAKANSGYVPPGSANDVESNTSSAGSAPAHDPSSEFVIEEATLKSMQNWHLALRLCYMSAAIFMGVAAGLSLQSQKNLGLIFFALYVLFFCAMICCFEFNLQMVASAIAVNFGFMYTLSGRMVFLLFVGFMSFSLGTLGIVAMCCLYAVGLFHGYLMYKFPRFEEYLRKKHYYEGKQASKTQGRH
jgi:hypothetical protein